MREQPLWEVRFCVVTPLSRISDREWQGTYINAETAEAAERQVRSWAAAGEYVILEHVRRASEWMDAEEVDGRCMAYHRDGVGMWRCFDPKGHVGGCGGDPRHAPDGKCCARVTRRADDRR